MFQHALSYADIRALYLRCRLDLQLHIRRYVRCSETAKDLAQDLYFRLERLANRLPNEEEARRYLFQTAANMARDQYRVCTNRARLLEEHAPPQHEPYLDESAAADMRETLERVQALIEEMPERRQAVFMQSRVLGLTYREIAAEHGISPSLVEKEVAATLSTLLRATAHQVPTSASIPGHLSSHAATERSS